MVEAEQHLPFHLFNEPIDPETNLDEFVYSMRPEARDNLFKKLVRKEEYYWFAYPQIIRMYKGLPNEFKNKKDMERTLSYRTAMINYGKSITDYQRAMSNYCKTVESNDQLGLIEAEHGFESAILKLEESTKKLGDSTADLTARIEDLESKEVKPEYFKDYLTLLEDTDALEEYKLRNRAVKLIKKMNDYDNGRYAVEIPEPVLMRKAKKDLITQKTLEEVKNTIELCLINKPRACVDTDSISSETMDFLNQYNEVI